MARKSEVAVVMYDERMYGGTGLVRRRWADSIEHNFVMWAKEEAPERSGELRAGIVGAVARTGPRQLNIFITSTAPHTKYVLKGTTGPIMSNRLWAFRNRTGLDLPRGGRFPIRQNGFITGFVPNMDFLNANYYTMRLRAWPEGGYPHETRALEVSGQEANNFMGRAAAHVARRHSSLRGFVPGTNFVSWG